MRLSTTSLLLLTTLNTVRIRRSTTHSHQLRLRDLPTQSRDLQCTSQLDALRHRKDLANTHLRRVARPFRSNHLNTQLVQWGHHPPSHMGTSLTRRDMPSQRHRQAQLLVRSINHLCQMLHPAHHQPPGNPKAPDMVARSDHTATLSNVNSTCMILRVLSTT
jgi:hypothetical protein